VPEFCQKDVPLAHFLARVMGRPLVFDPLAARYETKILDWRRQPPSSLQAWWNFRIDRWAFAWSDLILADTEAHKAYYCSAYGLKAEKVAVLPWDMTRPSSTRTVSAGRTRTGRSRFSSVARSCLSTAWRISSRRPASSVRLSRRSGSSSSGPARPTRGAPAGREYGLTNCEFRAGSPWSESPPNTRPPISPWDLWDDRKGPPRRAAQSLSGAGNGPARHHGATPAAGEILTDGETARLCGEPYGESLAAAILELKADQALRERLGTNGLRLVRERYAAKPTALRLKKILAERFG